MHRALPARVLPADACLPAVRSSTVSRASPGRAAGFSGFRTAPLPGRLIRTPKALILEPTGDGSTDHLEGDDSIPEAETITLKESGTLSVGREGTDVLLVPSTVSKRHATLSISGKEVIVTDAGSLNGTYVDLQELAEGQEASLPIGSEIIFGDEFLAKYALLDEEKLPAEIVAKREAKAKAKQPTKATLETSAVVEEADSTMSVMPQPPVPEVPVEVRKAEVQAWVKSWKAKLPAPAPTPTPEPKTGGGLGSFVGALLGRSSKDEEDSKPAAPAAVEKPKVLEEKSAKTETPTPKAKPPVPVAAGKPKADEVRGWTTVVREGQALVAKGVQGAEAEVPQVKAKAEPTLTPTPVPAEKPKEAAAAAAPVAAAAAEAATAAAAAAAVDPSLQVAIKERKAEVKDWVSSWRARSAGAAAVATKAVTGEVAKVVDVVEDKKAGAVGAAAETSKEKFVADATTADSKAPNKRGAAIYAFLASIHGAVAFVLLAAPGPVLQQCFAGAYTPPDMPLCSLCMRLCGALLLLPSAALLSLQKASLAGNLGSATYERLNAGLVISGLITTYLAATAAIGALSVAPVVWGAAIVPLLTAVSAGHVMAKANGGVGSIFSLIPSMLLGFPKTVSSLPYSIITKACLLMAVLLLFQPTVVHNAMVDETLLQAAIQWVKSTWDSSFSKTTLQMALQGIEPISPISEILKRFSGAALLMAATVAFVLKGGADRGRLGANTFKTLNKAFSVCSVITLLTLLYNFWPVWVSNVPEPTSVVVGICAAVAFSSLVTTFNWLFA